MNSPDTDRAFMAIALEHAKLAAEENEVPVGALVVRDGVVVGVGRNNCVADSDPTAHAEVNAIRAAAAHVSNYRLEDCTLFVTLEPCAMCAGAILNARFARLVYGAKEPKSGACGSVLNLFNLQDINHQTRVLGGVLAEECAAPLQHFFSEKRKHARANTSRLREDALRTPDRYFEQLEAYPWPPKYEQNLGSLAGLRMHYIDEGPPDAKTVFLCLHGNGSWSYYFRELIPIWLQAGCRVVAPDLIGFGKSDKPKRVEAHSLQFHAGYLQEWIAHLNLGNIILVVEEGALRLASHLPLAMGERTRGLLLLEANAYQSSATRLMGAYAAPFPDRGHKAGIDFWASNGQMTSDIPFNPNEFWGKDWKGVAKRVNAMDPKLAITALNAFVPR